MQGVGGGAGTYQQQRGLEDVVGKQQQQQHEGVGDQELELQGTAPHSSSWRLPVLLEALGCCPNAALVCNSDSKTPSIYIHYARKGGYGVQGQGGSGEGWPFWVQHARVAEAHMWSALHVRKQQLELQRAACLVRFAVLLLNDLLPPGVFLPWQLVLSYERVIPTSVLTSRMSNCRVTRQISIGSGLQISSSFPAVRLPTAAHLAAL